MTKAITVAAVLLFAAWAADQYFGYGYFTDGLLAMVGQIRQSFGW